MKKPLNIVAVAIVLVLLGWVVWRGFTHGHAGKDGDAKTEEKGGGEKKEEHEDFVVKLEKERWKALALEMAEPLKEELTPQRVAFGRVLDPMPIVALDGELASAEAALAASRSEFERTQGLLRTGEGMSRKMAETAEAQFRGDEIKADGLRRRASLEWGATFSVRDTALRRVFVEQLVRSESALVRVDLPSGDALAEMPTGARLLVLGHEEQPIETATITPATDTDAKTQAQGYVLRVDKPPFALRPGMALTAWLGLAQKTRAGFSVPRSAVLRHDGRTWVFIQEESEKFVRKPIVLDTPLDAEKGWFVAAEGGGIVAEDLLVVTGAQALLSEELKGQGGGEKE